MVGRTAPAVLDAADRRLLVALAHDGRKSAAALGKDLGLSRQAVAQRIRELERSGVIRGYRAEVEPAALGLTVRAQIRIALNGGLGPRREKEVVKLLLAHPMVRAVHRVSGEDCFVAQVVCRRIEDVNALLGQLLGTRALAHSRTAFVLETVIEKGSFGSVAGLVEEEP